ncbi:GlxA family transcriptional regulator [Pseudomonas sp. NCCP-436]|uniref:GlxA family transcriptional regulator n=1 Tax=Pseudomonas sp. NCCP-436 TaxID=2842481 RepID=UPI001C8248E8|nr:helix-turn-helix domain-containing protein [Pseudomonas sp. NCCP-436]GIZ10826.1 AraC family transcriptional regulator [Pseudomonas sp. NCCP-436]
MYQTPILRFLLLPLPEFALLPFGGFLDTLRFSADDEDYSRQRYCTWCISGLQAGQVQASSGAALQVEAVPEALEIFDYLVLFGGRNAQATAALAPAYRPLLRRAVRAGLKLVAIDNASFLLAACGLLEGHQVAVHWRHEAEFRSSFPQLRLARGRLYCLDGARISCAGGAAAIDLAVELLARDSGRSRALKGLADMLVDETRSSQHALRSLQVASSGERHVDRAVALMRRGLASTDGIEQLAGRVGLSRRQLDRLFRARLGMSARAYWNELRLQHVCWRLRNSSHSLAQIADEIGVADASHLGKLFRQRFGLSPGAYRRQN